jgi:tripartite-type tricarboxylate transporter receptor subunit TctC
MTLVVPFAPGSGSDVLARVLAPRLGENLGASVIVENVGGAGGMSGAARVEKAAPDGYQLLLASLGTYALNQTLYKKPLYNSATDFTPVALVAGTPILVVTRKDLPVSNLPEFIAYAKANQGKLQYGSPGVGSASHLACALFNATIGVEITHIPYRSTAQAMQDLLPGRIDYQCVPIAATGAQIEAGLVKAIATLSKNRSPILPMLMTAQEQGLADFDVDTWYAIVLPKGAPGAIVRKLHDAVLHLRVPVRTDLFPHPGRHHGRTGPRPAGEELTWSPRSITSSSARFSSDSAQWPLSSSATSSPFSCPLN